MSTLTTTTTSRLARRPAARIQARVQAWLDTLDPDMRKAVVSPSTWTGVTILAALVIAGAGIVPKVREIFQLRVEAAALCFLPTIVLGYSVGLLEKAGKLTLLTFGVTCAVGSAFFQFFMWSLVSLSEPPGAAMMASFPMLLAAYHGHVFCSSPRHPYIAVGTAFAVLGALLLNSDPDHLAIYAMAAPVTIGLSLVLGHIAAQGNVARLQRIALREAIDAQILHERAKQEEMIATALMRLQGTHHDAGNALSGALFNLEQLAIETARQPLDERRCRRIGDMAQDLSTSLERLRTLLMEARDTSRGVAPAFESVNVKRCVDDVVAELSLRFARKTIAGRCPQALLQARTSICGGETALRRVLMNIVGNACEGNGRREASAIEVRVAEGALNELMIEVLDDGPGFPEYRLEAPFLAFQTTKAGGSGLGLYTSDRLIRASGGYLNVHNRGGTGGAAVQIVLPGGGDA
jgi:two-component system C4-dicarboxylate transport sensor histidine kinase DctB